MNFSLLSIILLSIANLPPYGFIAFIAYIPLILYTQRSINGTFKTYFIIFFSQYVILLYWLVIPLTAFGDIYWVISICGLIFVSFYISCYLATAGLIAKYISKKTRISYLAIVPFSLSFFEYLRDYGIILSFPWGSPAYSLTNIPIIIQSASLLGHHGLIFYIILINCLLISRKKISGMILLCVTIFFMFYGAWRLENSKTKSIDNIKVSILQSNIEQFVKNQPTCYAKEIINRHLYLLKKAKSSTIDFAIWPESSYPYQVVIEHPNITLNNEIIPNSLIPANSINLQGANYNSAYVINKKNKVISRIDKSYLVPLGEYIPWPINLLSKTLKLPIEKFSQGNKSILPIRFKNRSIGVTICYEGLSANLNKKLSKKGAHVLINISNDGWYGFSKCPQQHFNIYKIRSIETGHSYVRANNTGISGWLDYVGNAYKQTNLFQQSLTEAIIPINSELTLFMKGGYYFPIICGAVIISIIFLIYYPAKSRNLKNMLINLTIILFLHAVFCEKKINLEEIAQTKSIFFLIFSLVVLIKIWNRQY